MASLGPYEPPLSDCVRALKFGSAYGLAGWLGAALAGEIRRQTPVLPPPVAVVGVPMPWRRRVRRGYNQADQLARAVVAAGFGQDATGLLRRAGYRRPQTRLTAAQRRANARRGFRLMDPRLDLAEASVLLVDDVVTTGATLRAAASTLRARGCHRIGVAVVACTSDRGDHASVGAGFSGDHAGSWHGRPRRPACP